MKNKKLEMISYQCQCGMYFTKILKLKNGYIVYSDTVEDFDWNFLFGFTAKTITQFDLVFEEATRVLKKINRTPVFAISPLCKISKEVKKYIFTNYDCFAENVILLTSKFTKKYYLPADYSFKQIDNEREKELFVETFKTSKSQTMPGDTYEALPPFYSKALEESFIHHGDWEFVHFLSLYKKSPIGMVSTCIKDKYCGIYGGGTYVKYRNKGVFTNMLNFIYMKSRQKKVKYFFCITEKNSKNEKYYNKLGWKTKYTTTLFKEKLGCE